MGSILGSPYFGKLPYKGYMVVSITRWTPIQTPKRYPINHRSHRKGIPNCGNPHMQFHVSLGEGRASGSVVVWVGFQFGVLERAYVRFPFVGLCHGVYITILGYGPNIIQITVVVT